MKIYKQVTLKELNLIETINPKAIFVQEEHEHFKYSGIELKKVFAIVRTGKTDRRYQCEELDILMTKKLYRLIYA